MELTPLPSPCLYLGASSSPGPRLASLGLEELDLYIRYQVADRIATITLDRPEAANAQNGELLDQLDAAWVRAAQTRMSRSSCCARRANTSPPDTI